MLFCVVYNCGVIECRIFRFGECGDSVLCLVEWCVDVVRGRLSSFSHPGPPRRIFSLAVAVAVLALLQRC